MAGEKTVRIREYDSLVDESRLERLGIVAPLGCTEISHEAFEALESFVLENRGEGTEPLELMTLGARRGVGKTITASNYVGVISLRDGFSVQILPKLTVGGDEETERRALIRMLREVSDLPLKSLDTARLMTARTSVLEPLMRMFAQASANLAKRGLRGDYLTNEGNERFFRGKLDLAQDIRNNHSRRDRIYVHYDEFSVDRPENRVIKATLRHLRLQAHSSASKREIDFAIHSYDRVSDTSDALGELSRCHLDRTLEGYRPVLRWCEIFLRGEAFTSFSGSEVASALLFPMERLFESYVAKLICRTAAGVGWRATTQDTGLHLFDSPKRFRLRPDIVLRREGRAPVVLDTKWKRVGIGANDGISQADVYQMYVYQKRYGASGTVLVYPAWERAMPGVLRTFSGEDGTLVEAFAFDLANSGEATRQLLSRVAIAE